MTTIDCKNRLEIKMKSGMTVTIPRQLYKRVQSIAQKQRRHVNDVAKEMLEQGLLPLEGFPAKAEKEREKEAFRQLHDALQEQYMGEFVAIYNGALVDHDLNQAALVARIDKKYPDLFVLIRPVQQEPEIVYEHRSLHWA
jgi:predicted transcriptional regulator